MAAVLLTSMGALGLLGMLTLASARSGVWWTLPALWIATTAVSFAIYLAPIGDVSWDPFAERLVLAALVCGAIGLGVSRHARHRPRLWATLPTAMVGVVTPPAAVVALLVISCETGGFCPS